MLFKYFLFFLAFHSFSYSLEKKTPQELFQSLKNFYRNNKVLELEFSIVNKFSFVDEWSNIKGYLYISQDTFHFKTESLEWICDGRSIWKYNVAEKQVVIVNLNSIAKEFHPQYTIKGYLDWKFLSVQHKNNIYEVTIKPNANSNYKKAVLSISNKIEPIQIHLWDEQNNQTIYKISKIIKNRRKEIKYLPKKDVEVIDMR